MKKITPQDVRQRVSSLPAWFEVRIVPDNSLVSFPVTLHRGERDAILLAETLRPDVLLIDEQSGRRVALNRNLPLSGTLGVLERADTLGWIDNFPKTLQELREHGFFITENLEQQLLRRNRLRLESR